jgi:hypothetical protein
LLEALRGLTVPARAAEVADRFDARVLALARDACVARWFPLTGPIGGPEAAIAALNHVGVLGRLPDERINMPDIYRTAAGVKRKGGIKPVK